MAVGSRKRQILNWPLPGQGTGATISPFGPPIVANYPPTPNDQGDFVGQLWLVPGATSWVLNRQGNTTNLWQEIGAGTGAVLQLRGDNAGLASPVGGIINEYSGGQGRATPDVITTASGQTVSIDLRNSITLGDISALTSSQNALTAVTGSITTTQGQFFANGANSTRGGITLMSSLAGNLNDAFVAIQKNAGTPIANGESLGSIAWLGADGSGGVFESARITVLGNGGTTIGQVPSYMQFNTTGASGEITRMTIGSTGTVTINTPDSGVGLTVAGGGVTATGPITFPTVYGDTIGSTNLPVFIDSTGLLGTSGGTSGTLNSWTPTVIGASTAGTTTYSFHTGVYVRIGNLIWATASIGITGATGTGDATFSLPVTVNSSVTNALGTCSLQATGWSWPANGTTLFFSATSNTTTGVFTAMGSARSLGNLQMANASANIIYTVVYSA